MRSRADHPGHDGNVLPLSAIRRRASRAVRAPPAIAASRSANACDWAFNLSDYCSCVTTPLIVPLPKWLAAPPAKVMPRLL